MSVCREEARGRYVTLHRQEHSHPYKSELERVYTLSLSAVELVESDLDQ